MDESVRRRMRGWSIGRGQRHCTGCGHYLPMAWTEALCAACSKRAAESAESGESGDAQWKRLLADPDSAAALDALADEALAAQAAGQTLDLDALLEGEQQTPSEKEPTPDPPPASAPSDRS